jgi:hypothetical protein
MIYFSEGSVQKKAHLLLLNNAGHRKKQDSVAVERREVSVHKLNLFLMHGSKLNLFWTLLCKQLCKLNLSWTWLCKMNLFWTLLWCKLNQMLLMLSKMNLLAVLWVGLVVLVRKEGVSTSCLLYKLRRRRNRVVPVVRRGKINRMMLY